jgi:uncharacterized membrane protein
MKKQRPNIQLLIFLTLLFASTVAAAMVVSRAFYSGRLLYGFLIWNLVLAWMPFLLAWTAFQKPMVAIVYGPLWLLFFPNAPYLVTDLIHLQPFHNVPLWFDAMMLFTFALTGLLLGFLSLYFMQSLVAQRFGHTVGWLFTILATGLSSYGVYVGRFLRWNSWDIFTQPVSLLTDIVNSLVNPEVFIKTYTVSFSLSAIMLFAYIILYSLPHLETTVRVRK